MAKVFDADNTVALVCGGRRIFEVNKSRKAIMIDRVNRGILDAAGCLGFIKIQVIMSGNGVTDRQGRFPGSKTVIRRSL